MTGQRADPEQTDTVQLRVLHTTDLHMHLAPYDYDALRPTSGQSLSDLQAHIATLRDTDIPTVLCDTGDFLQGTAMADTAMTGPKPHPMIAAFNAMNYTAVVLGNHDFDYGLPALRETLADLTCPALAANLTIQNDPPLADDFVIVPVATDHGIIHVGLLGLTIQPAPLVHATRPAATITTAPARDTAQRLTPRMKDAGADLIIALCHFGILEQAAGEDNGADIAALPDIDAVMAGHSHDIFPGDDFPASDVIDPVAGTVHGKPATMAGAFGCALGVIDFTLQKNATGWHIDHAHSHIIRPDLKPDSPTQIPPSLRPLHAETLGLLGTPLTETPSRLSTFFSMIEADRTQQLLAHAKIGAVTEALAQSDFAELPVLATAAPYRAGSKDTPTGFLDIPPGPITRRDALAIYPFQDPVIALHRTGEQLCRWLEYGARRFLTVQRGQNYQPLLDPDIPPYKFLSIFGLTYTIDLSQDSGRRIADVRYQGRPLQPTDTVVLATTPTRIAQLQDASAADHLAVTQDSVQSILQRHLQRQPGLSGDYTCPWQLAQLPDTAAQFVTSELATPDLTARRVRPTGKGNNGLQLFTLSLG